MGVPPGSFPALVAFVLLTVSCFGTSGEAPTNAVPAILGRDVSFPVKVSPGKYVEKIEWDIISPVSRKPYQLCVLRGWGLTKTESSKWFASLMENVRDHSLLRNVTKWALQYKMVDMEKEFVTNLITEHMFGHRLEMADRTTLKIKRLQKFEAVVYKARVWFDTEHFEDHIFNVTLYDPAPTPVIYYDDLIKTPEGCNVTLQCQAQEAGKYNISWEKVSALREIPFSDYSRYLSVSWRKGSSPSTFTCLVCNPADQKKASFDLLKICQEVESPKGSFGPSIPWAPILSILPAITCLLLMVCILYRKEKNKSRNRGIPSVAVEETAHRSPPENPMMNLPVMSSAPESTTISPPTYDEVQVGRHGDQGTLSSEPPPYDSLFDSADPLTCGGSKLTWIHS